MPELLLTGESGVGVGPHLAVGVGLALRESEARSEASVASYGIFPWLLTRLGLSFDEVELSLIHGDSGARECCRSVSLKVNLRELLAS